MDKKLLLIQAITLLFRESQLTDTTFSSATMIRPIVESVSVPDMNIGVIDTERDILIAFKAMALDMCDHHESVKPEKLDLFQKIKFICGDDTVSFEAFMHGADKDLDEQGLQKLCLGIRRNFKKYAEEVKIREIITKADWKFKFKREEIKNIHSFVQEIYSELEPYQFADNGDKDPAIISKAASDEDGSLAKAFKSSQDLNQSQGKFILGWQGINRMTQDGFRRGDSIVCAGLQHNFKTGFTLSLFKQMAMYNTPFMLDPSKKPMLLHISFENSLEMNMPFLYKNIYENKTGQQADLRNKTVEELEEYVRMEMGVNGYITHFLHVNPTLWSYMDICNYVTKLEAMGYEVHCLMVDYLNMIPKTGCDNTGPMGSNIRDLFRRMANFCRAKRITFITPHQLSVDAKVLMRNGATDQLVKDIANGGYYDGCKTIDNEVDLELYFHIVKAQDGKSYLCVQRGKHRGLQNQTKAEHLYCVLAFEDIGDIRDDLHGPDLTRKKPGHAPMGQGGNTTPFWDYETPEVANQEMAMA